MKEAQRKDITPVIVMAASRNGGTSLVNDINGFPEVAGVEHELHHGSHEPKLYGHYKYYGNFNTPDAYIDFLYHYSSEDFFQLAKGSVDYHLKNRRNDFFDFFFDMMDRYCILEKKQFWVVKIDPAFFTDIQTFNYFLQFLDDRYQNVRYIKIQRAMISSLQSFLYMEGEGYKRRNKKPFKYFSILAYVQSWFKVYVLKNKSLEGKNILLLDFKEYIKTKENAKERIREYLGLLATYNKEGENKVFDINTSFSKKKREKLSEVDKVVANTYFKLLKTFPVLVFVGNRLVRKKRKSPIYRKLLKYKYFREDFRIELKNKGAHKILDIVGENRKTQSNEE